MQHTFNDRNENRYILSLQISVFTKITLVSIISYLTLITYQIEGFCFSVYLFQFNLDISSKYHFFETFHSTAEN